MDNVITEQVQNILHIGSQALLVPVMMVLAVLVIYVVFCVGTLIAEYFTEHRHLNASIPDLMDSIDAAQVSELSKIINDSGLLKRQRTALQTVVDHSALPFDDLLALAQKLLYTEEAYYEKVVSHTDYVAKIGPMFGLMGTLIPLGPGIVALSGGDTETLSNALLIAFDTTVAGLIAAAVAVTVSKWRRRWYGDYMAMLEATMTAVLKKLDTESEG